MKKYIFVLLLINKPFFAMEDWDKIEIKSYSVEQPNIEKQVEKICNSLIGNENLGFQAYKECLSKKSYEDRNTKRDACLLQRLYYECAMRKQFKPKEN